MKKFIFILFLVCCSVNHAEVTSVPSVDLGKYVGKWYEVASIPQYFQRKCISNTSAEYSLLEDGMIKVENSCDTESGDRKISEGRAKVVDTKTNSKLEVTFVKIFTWVFSFGGDYWIIDLASDYSYALVGGPNTKYAWLLSRVPNPSIEVFKKAEEKFRSFGYDTCQILTSNQKGGFEKRSPLCEIVKN